MSRLTKKLNSQKMIMIIPGVAIYLIFMALPIAVTIYYGTTDWNGVTKSWNMVGFENFQRSFIDTQFLYSIKFTLLFAVVVTFFTNTFGLMLAVFLDGESFGQKAYRTIIFLPLLISPIAAGFVWKALFSYTGIINTLLENWFSVETIMFLGKPGLAKIILIAFTLWQNIGFCMVIYLAGIQTIPKDLYDATTIDGATSKQRFFYITFQYLAPSTTSSVLLMFTSAMREYPRPLVLTAGGPFGQTETLAFRIFKVGFDANQLGYASALAVWVLLITTILSLVISWKLRKREEFLK